MNASGRRNMNANISNASKEEETVGAGAYEDAMLALLQDLVAEIRAFREVFMTVVSHLLKTLLSCNH